MKTKKWQKSIPKKDGLYWCKAKGRSDKRVMCTITTQCGYLNEPPIRVITIDGSNTLLIENCMTEDQSRIMYGYPDIIFWTIPIIHPKLPKSHPLKRIAK